VGASAFALGESGAGPGAADFGGTLFAVMGFSHGWYIRPTITLGDTVVGASSSWLGAYAAFRLDACGRVEHFVTGEVALDYCAGVELGYHTAPASQSTLLLLPGPSLGTRFPLASDLWLETRFAGGFNVGGLFKDSNAGTAQPAGPILRFELGLAWRVEKP
jgi:hypothetical protein